MKRILLQSAIILQLFAFGGCSTYNAYAPEWAKIGAEETSSETSAESESTWWNPFSW